MKARIKATGEIVDLAPYTRVYEDFAKGRSWLVEELDDADDAPDYWARLTHQAAITAMQGIMSNPVGFENIRCTTKDTDKKVAEIAICFAKELVKGLRIEHSN